MGTGVFSRSTLALNLWIAVATGLSFQLVTTFLRPGRAVPAALAVFLVAGLALASVRETLRWKETWDFEQEVLRRIPVQVLRATTGKILLLADLPTPAGRIEGFEAYWDISAALHLRHPDLAPRVEAAVSRGVEWETSWDGVVLRQSWCRQRSVPLWSLEASQVIEWKFAERESRIIRPPFRSGCEKEP